MQEDPQQDPLTGRVIGCAIEVHRALGPGLLESTYQQCLARELALQEVRFTLVYPLPVEHKGVHLDCGYRIDIFVEDQLAVELRAVKEISGIHQAQLLTYLKLSDITTGLLIDSNTKLLKDGMTGLKV